MGVGVMSDYTLQRRYLNSSHTLGYTGKIDSKPNTCGHDTEGDYSPGQTCKKPKDLSAYARVDRGCGEGVVGWVCACCACVIVRSVSMGRVWV
jgi:hypothetical protein